MAHGLYFVSVVHCVTWAFCLCFSGSISPQWEELCRNKFWLWFIWWCWAASGKRAGRRDTLQCFLMQRRGKWWLLYSRGVPHAEADSYGGVGLPGDLDQTSWLTSTPSCTLCCHCFWSVLSAHPNNGQLFLSHITGTGESTKPHLG